MSVIIIDGKPGMGKTLLLTWFGYKDFKQKNPPFKVWFTEKIKRKKWLYDNSIYSDFPILLKKPKKKKQYLVQDDFTGSLIVPFITSLECRLFDLYLENKFREKPLFLIDEVQQKYDSMDYKDFPDSIAHYFQLHRHFDANIVTNSQSQSRIPKRILVLGCEYWTITSFRLLFGFVIMHIRITYDMHNNLESNNGNTNVDYTERRIIFRLKTIGSLYDSKYCRHLQDDSKPYKTKMYSSLDLSKQQLLYSFFPTNEEKEHLKNMRY